MFKLRRTILFLLSGIFVSIFSHSCNEAPLQPEEISVEERGYVFSSKELATYTPAQIEQILMILKIEHALTLSYSVKVLRIEYQTIDADGAALHASGALMIPVTSETLPVLSINHGTVTKRNEVASEGPLNSVEGAGGLITGSLGYVTCVPDYIGFGVSNEMHPYMHAKSLAISVIDMIRATRTYCQTADINLSDHLYLTGYSEGGYATLATQKEIEQNYSLEFSLTAVAPMAGPYDLAGIVESGIGQESYPSRTYIAFLLTAYNDLYGWNRLAEIFSSPYAAMMTTLFNGTKSYAEIENQLREEITPLLKPGFVTSYLNGDEPEIIEAMEENSLLDWSPVTTIKFFHGDADKVSPYDNVLRTVTQLRSQSAAQIDLVTINGGTHETAGLPCIFGMINWFEGIEKGLLKSENYISQPIVIMNYD